jgi:hypothetical protein
VRVDLVEGVQVEIKISDQEGEMRSALEGVEDELTLRVEARSSLGREMGSSLEVAASEGEPSFGDETERREGLRAPVMPTEDVNDFGDELNG